MMVIMRYNAGAGPDSVSKPSDQLMASSRTSAPRETMLATTKAAAVTPSINDEATNRQSVDPQEQIEYT